MMFARMHSNERGSLIMALLAVLVIGGLVTVLLARTISGQRQTRFDRDFERALQTAEVGLDRAVTQVVTRARTDSFCYDGTSFTSPPCTMTPASGSYVVSAVKDASSTWTIRAIGTDGDRERVIRTQVEPGTLFNMAAFGKFFADFNGGNGADSYSSGNWDYGTTPRSFNEDNSRPLICNGGPTGSEITDPNDANQSNQYICQARRLAIGIVATNGRLFLKGQTTADSDAIEIHNAMAPNVSDPHPDATGYCDGVTATCTSSKLSYFRDPIDLPDIDVPCTASEEFPNASTTTDGSGNYLLSPGNHCFTDVTLTENVIVQGTPTDPTRLFLTGSLTVPNHDTVNFQRDGSGNILPLPEPTPGFLIFSTGTGPSLNFGNHAAIAAAIYAPKAEFSGGSQGNVYGSLVASSINNNGGWNFHYDEALRQVFDLSPMSRSNWTEE